MYTAAHTARERSLMSDDEYRPEHEPEHTVVVNGEEQYSVWPVLLPVPGGWREAGFRGSRSACLEHIALVWTDLRPLSLRSSLSEG
jgi:MbtH protein